MPRDRGDLSAVSIIGTIGAGKTALAEALSEILHSKGIRHALIDVDWLGQLFPPPDSDEPYSLDLAFSNLRTIAPNFLEAGAKHFVISVTLTTRDELDQLRRALPPASVTVCRIEASPEAIAERIRGRELGSLRNDFLQRTDVLAHEIRTAGLEDLVVVNEGRPIGEAAQELFEALRWG